jgi:predicted anti-sigma-YlaC factor YlaD
MGCTKWEESGLLYCSSELDEAETKNFEEHLGTCEECRDEYETYQKEKQMFFTADILSETPSKKVDDEILRVCASGQKVYTNTGFFTPFLKKTLFSVTFFIMGFVVVSYFTINMENADRKKQSLALERTALDSSTMASSTQVTSGAVNDSSKKDSANDSNLYYSKTRGNLGTNGVFPVDLKAK